MTTFAVTDPAHTIAALNYALSNLNTGNVSGNVTIPGNVLVANTTTGAISTYGNAAVISYQNEFLNVRYANSAIGSSGFSTNQANSQYYGVYNTVTNTDPGVSNPANYQWFQVTGGFGTSKILYYLCNGGRQVQLAATVSAPSSGFLATVNGTPINLDIVTTANGTPGTRGAIAMGYVITPNDPNTSGNTALSTWFAASRTANVPPIGTGLTPVSGDTADFFYPVTGVSGAFTFDGSGWANVVAQVVAGNTIVDGTITGNTIANSTITGNNIQVDTVSGNVIIANTLAGNTIIANTLYGNAIIANTLYGNAIIANTISGNAIIANTISGNTIIANSFTANSINGSAVIAGSIAANTINGNSIVSGSITADQLAANAITANTVVSTGATLGSNTSPGFWLDGTTGNARFGNSLSVGNLLSVGSNATIGTNLIVGANANIGGNLFVSGLVTSGALNNNTVNTTTINTGAVSSFTSYQFAGSSGIAPPASNVWVTWQDTSSILTLTTVQSNQTVFIWFNAEYAWTFAGLGGAGTTNCTVSARLIRRDYPAKAVTTPLQTWTTSFTMGNGSTANPIISPNPTTYVDTVPVAGTYQYMWQLQYTTSTLNVNCTAMTISSTGTYAGPGYTTPLNLLGLALKR